MKKNIALLIGIIFGFLFASLFTSCKKEPITPGNYQPNQTVVDTTNWQDQYGNGGTLPTWGTPNNNNDLFGTKWVVTTVITPHPVVTTYPNDTVYFIDNTHYKVGVNGFIKTYNFSTNNVGSTLTINNFVTIYSLFFTCNNVVYNSFSNVNINGTVILKLKNVNIISDIYTTTFKKI
jgi:hypothetical protein